MGRRAPTPRWHSCNVLQNVAPAWRLWRFAVNETEVALTEQYDFPSGQTLPSQSVQRGWSDLWRPRLNVAWLPADHVYIRVVHLPKGEPDELRPMLELQLEKLSPAPLNQVVWTYQPVTHPEPDQQSAIVIIADRSSVESYLGGLEQQGYLADRLEMPWLHQVLAKRPSADQTSLYLVTRDQVILCLTAWWYNQTLQYLDLFTLDHTDAAPARLVDQLVRVAWAGEVEGWLSGTPRWQLTATKADLETWAPQLRQKLDDAVETQVAPELGDLAQMAARRGVRGESTANLMPADHVARYRQQYIDRLWMRGLGALTLVYVFLVLLYFAGVQILEHRESQLRGELAALSGSYTNALQLKERVRVFTEQAELKFAALNSLRIASELLPPELMLTSFTFQGGRSLRLVGTVAPDQQERVTEYNAELRRATIDGTPLFDKQNYDPPYFTPYGTLLRWDFKGDLSRAFTE